MTKTEKILHAIDSALNSLDPQFRADQYAFAYVLGTGHRSSGQAIHA